MMKQNIYPIELIGSGVLSVMAKPTSGYGIDYGFKVIAEAGVDSVVSLLESQEADEVGLQDERQLVEKNGMKFIAYPIPDMSVPTSLDVFVEMTKCFYHEINNGLNMVIHCYAGIGRTSLVAGGILLHCGFEPDEAFEHIASKRGEPVPETKEQKDWFFDNYAAIVNK